MLSISEEMYELEGIIPIPEIFKADGFATEVLNDSLEENEVELISIDTLLVHSRFKRDITNRYIELLFMDDNYEVTVYKDKKGDFHFIITQNFTDDYL